MKKIKVMHFIHGLSIGGAETLVKDYALNLDREKIDIVILCLSHADNSPYESMLSDSRIRVIYVEDSLKFKSKTNIISKIINHFHRYLIVKRVIRCESPDVLHTHLTVNTFVKFARPQRKVAIFHTIHSEPEKIWMSDNHKKKDFRSVKWLIKNRNMRLIALHENMKKKADELFGVQDTIVLNNGIDIRKFSKVQEKEKNREKLGLPMEAFIIGHVGRFLAVKNHAFIVDVFSEIKRKKNDAYLLLIGDGPDREKIINKLDEKNLNGDYKILSNRNDIHNILNAIDVFILPSLYEGSPLSLIEAQTAGLPCFISSSIDDYTTISNLVTKISLKQPATEWSDHIISYIKPKHVEINATDWDIREVANKMTDVYLTTVLERQNEAQ